VFVGDYNNGRIMRFTSASALLNGSVAEVQLFGVTGVFTATQSTLNGVYQMTIFNTTLFASDGDSCRIMRIDGVTTANATIANATNVYGQANFTNQCVGGGTTLNDMGNAYGVTVSNNQTLWVSDNTNQLVKRFDSILSLSNYPAPNAFFGTNGTNNLTQSTFTNLRYLALDRTNGHLFVNDNSRVLLFKSASTKLNGSAADTVFGAANFTSTSVTCDGASISNSFGVFYDSNTNSLFVADKGNFRVLVFSNPVAALNGSNATAQIGQADLTTCTGIVAANASTISPYDVTYSPDFPGIFTLVADDLSSRVSRHQCSNNTFSATTTRSASVPASSIVPNSSSGAIAPSSSGVAASSSGAVAASSSGAVAASSSGAVAASSSGAVAASSSGVVNASSSGVPASSSGVPASSSGVPASSSGVPASSSGVPPSGSDTASGPALSGSGTGTKSLSNTPSVTNPNALTPSNSAIAPPPPVAFGTSGVKLAVCGNGALEAGEQCDPGAAVPRTKCCTQFCTNLPVRAVCGRATSLCTRRPKCGRVLTSRQLVCNPGTAKPVGSRCGRGGLFSRKRCQTDGTCK